MVDTPHTFGDWAVEAFHKHTQRIFKYEHRVLRDQDPEDLHQLRVGMRRLRTAIAGFGPAVQLPKGLGEKSVGAMGRILGAQRDNDVLQELLTVKYRPHLPAAEQPFLDRLLKQLQKQRQKAFKHTCWLLTDDKFKRFRRQWQKWLDEPQFTTLGTVPLPFILPDLLLPQLSHFFLHPGWLVGTEEGSNSAETATTFNRRCVQLTPQAIQTLLDGEETVLHSLRKEAKRTRYQLEIFSACYGPGYHQLLQQVKQVQEILGDLQDDFVLRAMVEQQLEGDLASLCPHWAGLFTGDRLQCWSQWQPLQAQLIDPEYRRQCRQWLQCPLGDS